jgi:hypothetical protein
MRCTMLVCSVFFKNWSHVWSGRCTKTSHFLYVFLRREMLVQLVNFEKCHSPLRSWLSPTGTVSSIHSLSAGIIADTGILNKDGQDFVIDIIHVNPALISSLVL